MQLISLRGYAHASLVAGEQFTLAQLLEVLLIHSANDAANVLAEKVAGSVPAFANMMNQKALELGCLNTHFVNPSGIHDDNHYSTAFDLSIIGNYAMKNEIFRQYVSKISCSLPATAKYPNEDRLFTTTNSLLLTESPYYYAYAIGAKTGFTTPAQNCLVAVSNHNGTEYLSVILGAVQLDDGTSQRYQDTIHLLEYASSHYELRQIKNANDVVTEVTLPNIKQSLTLLASEGIIALDKIQNLGNNIEPEITLNENLSAPIYAGNIVGKATYTVDGTKYEIDLVAANDVVFDSSFSFVLKVGMLIILLLLIYFLLFPPSKKSSLENKVFKITHLN